MELYPNTIFNDYSIFIIEAAGAKEWCTIGKRCNDWICRKIDSRRSGKRIASAMWQKGWHFTHWSFRFRSKWKMYWAQRWMVYTIRIWDIRWSWLIKMLAKINQIWCSVWFDDADKKKRIKTALCTTLPLLGVHRWSEWVIYQLTFCTYALIISFYISIKNHRSSQHTKHHILIEKPEIRFPQWKQSRNQNQRAQWLLNQRFPLLMITTVAMHHHLSTNNIPSTNVRYTVGIDKNQQSITLYDWFWLLQTLPDCLNTSEQSVV